MAGVSGMYILFKSPLLHPVFFLRVAVEWFNTPNKNDNKLFVHYTFRTM